MTGARTLLKLIFVLAICALAPSAGARADISEAAATFPNGWQPMQAPSVDVRFAGDRVPSTAYLVHSAKGDQYGVAVIRGQRRGRRASIVTVFQDIATNPPSLGKVAPGVIRPWCGPASACPAITVRGEALSVCFGEASCQVIFVNGNKFDAVFVTD